ncbi:hypothetical protein [Clostridium estertheticum]|uniref:hypothetical protein n=1 Tax=Clostridium estertheticum TaxID=238834 RepID=UPI001CF253E7|nr:hypothetical protein [Clostridium estertheticum]MCB2354485.1 hypothetical protein [Clostridium estertheticum]WAG42402.1 hypothetical protein LL065_06915 [Clostridium estertheticum]
MNFISFIINKKEIFTITIPFLSVLLAFIIFLFNSNQKSYDYFKDILKVKFEKIYAPLYYNYFCNDSSSLSKDKEFNEMYKTYNYLVDETTNYIIRKIYITESQLKLAKNDKVLKDYRERLIKRIKAITVTEYKKFKKIYSDNFSKHEMKSSTSPLVKKYYSIFNILGSIFILTVFTFLIVYFENYYEKISKLTKNETYIIIIFCIILIIGFVWCIFKFLFSLNLDKNLCSIFASLCDFYFTSSIAPVTSEYYCTSCKHHKLQYKQTFFEDCGCKYKFRFWRRKDKGVIRNICLVLTIILVLTIFIGGFILGIKSGHK